MVLVAQSLKNENFAPIGGCRNPWFLKIPSKPCPVSFTAFYCLQAPALLTGKGFCRFYQQISDQENAIFGDRAQNIFETLTEQGLIIGAVAVPFRGG